MSQKIRKAVIPVAGYGTRFLPATKAQPKEMLPVIDKPIIQYVIEEAVASGIEDIIIVTSPNKRTIEDHFDNLPDLELWLEKNGKQEQLEKLRKISKLANFIYIRQKGPYGNGTPILNARRIIGDEPFAVLWGDDIMIGLKPGLKQLVEVYEKYQGPVLAALTVDDSGTNKYAILDTQTIENDIYQVKSIVEKPGPAKAPSHLGQAHGYLLTPDIFDILAHTPLGKNNELWLVDAISQLIQKRPVYARKIEGTYYDTGSKLGWLQANIALGLEHPELKEDLKQFLLSKLK